MAGGGLWPPSAPVHPGTGPISIGAPSRLWGEARHGEETKGKSTMKKLLIATALAAMAGAAFVGQGHAAPAAKDPMCGVAPQMGSQSWNDQYHCWGTYTPAKPVAAKPSKKDPMCSVAPQMGSQSWADKYQCWK
jgi:hypothetical protein